MRITRFFPTLSRLKLNFAPAILLGTLALAACGAGTITGLELDQWRSQWAAKGAIPLEAQDFLAFDTKRAKLGQALFFDKILSGNKNISCSTCHHHTLGTTDQLPLGIGEGGRGLGQRRTVGHGPDLIHERVPRNSPALFNAGAKDITFVFHDGRLAIDESQPSGFRNPAKDNFPKGLNHIIAAQAMFPPTSATEMAGQGKENAVAVGTEAAMHNTWPLLAARVQGVPAYVASFGEVYPDVKSAEDITMVHIANALGDFVIGEWQSFDTPYDRFLRGDTHAMGEKARRGMDLFFGKAKCSTCHSGPLLTDHDFHSLTVPQFGGGKMPADSGSNADRGREAVTKNAGDAFAFRTPALRNVALTGPFMHDGAYATLEAVIRHHADPVRSFKAFEAEDVRLPAHPDLAASDFAVMQETAVLAEMAASNDLKPMRLSFEETQALAAFLRDGLTESRISEGRLGPLTSVPSGLPLD